MSKLLRVGRRGLFRDLRPRVARTMVYGVCSASPVSSHAFTVARVERWPPAQAMVCGPLPHARRGKGCPPLIGAARERCGDGGCPRPGRPLLKAKRRTPGLSRRKSFGAEKWVRRSPEVRSTVLAGPRGRWAAGSCSLKAKKPATTRERRGTA